MPSTVITSVHYDATHQTLTITYRSGKTYCYFDVPADVYAAYKSSFSKGRFLNRVIKDHYRFAQVEENGGFL